MQERARATAMRCMLLTSKLQLMSRVLSIRFLLVHRAVEHRPSLPETVRVRDPSESDLGAGASGT